MPHNCLPPGGGSVRNEASSIQYPIGERNASSEKARIEFTLWPVSKIIVTLHEGRSEIPEGTFPVEACCDEQESAD